MADKALYVVGQKRFVQTMRKAGADMQELKEVNRRAADIAKPEAVARAPRGKTGRLAGSIRAGRKTVPYAGPINYGWPARNIRPRTFVNDAVASTESQWAKEYETFVKKTMNQIKGA